MKIDILFLQITNLILICIIGILLYKLIILKPPENKTTNVKIHLFLESAPGTSIYLERKTYEFKKGE